MEDFCSKNYRLYKTSIFIMIARHRRKYTHQAARIEVSGKGGKWQLKHQWEVLLSKKAGEKLSTGKRQKFLPRYTIWKKLKALSLILIFQMMNQCYLSYTYLSFNTCSVILIFHFFSYIFFSLFLFFIPLSCISQYVKKPDPPKHIQDILYTHIPKCILMTLELRCCSALNAIK